MLKRSGTNFVFPSRTAAIAALGSASEVEIRENRDGISEDAVSAVTADATFYMPFADLVDVEKEIARLEGEEKKLSAELARSEKMLTNERFLSKAPAEKVAEEKEKQEKYRQMMAQVQERLGQLRK